MTDLKRVKAGKVLHWPASLAGNHDGDRNIRLREGGILDADAPCEKFFLAGQEYKLESVNAGVPAKHNLPAAVRMVREHERAVAAGTPPPTLSADEKAESLGIMPPDAPPAPAVTTLASMGLGDESEAEGDGESGDAEDEE